MQTHRLAWVLFSLFAAGCATAPKAIVTTVHTVQVPLPQMTGGLAPDKVAKVLWAHIDVLDHCFEEARQTAPALEGTVVLAWTIFLDGHPHDLRVDRTTANSSILERCLLDRLREWRFPKPRRVPAQVVSYPLEFRLRK